MSKVVNINVLQQMEDAQRAYKWDVEFEDLSEEDNYYLNIRTFGIVFNLVKKTLHITFVQTVDAKLVFILDEIIKKGLKSLTLDSQDLGDKTNFKLKFVSCKPIGHHCKYSGEKNNVIQVLRFQYEGYELEKCK